MEADNTREMRNGKTGIKRRRMEPGREWFSDKKRKEGMKRENRRDPKEKRR